MQAEVFLGAGDIWDAVDVYQPLAVVGMQLSPQTDKQVAEFRADSSSLHILLV